MYGFFNPYFLRKEIFHLITYSTYFIYGYIVKDHSDSLIGSLLPTLHGLLFRISTISLTGQHTPQFVIPDMEPSLELEIAKSVHHEGSIQQHTAP